MSEASVRSIIQLDGDWSMGGVAEKFSVLTALFSSLTGSQASDKNQPADQFAPEIDLSGITEFDVCGCQLLVLFVRQLKQYGICAQLTKVPEKLRSKVNYFGFDRELNLTF